MWYNNAVNEVFWLNIASCVDGKWCVVNNRNKWWETCRIAELFSKIYLGWYSALWCNIIQFATIQCDIMQYDSMMCDTIIVLQCDTIKFDTIQCDKMQCDSNTKWHYYSVIVLYNTA